jgi:hypothetical protein
MGFAVLAPAQAQSLADPTRPAAEWLAMQPAAPGSAPVAGPADAPDAESLPAASIVVTGKSRNFALVDGQVVAVGKRFSASKPPTSGTGSVVWKKHVDKDEPAMKPATEKKIGEAGPTVRKSKPAKHVVNGED